ncbi:MAG: ABC transporter permease [Cellulomonadaceae bacterium]|jgi:simple sugar transport system permease protein|nr:ABC transporter permease [Cellulomonadaceae bacterium]
MSIYLASITDPPELDLSAAEEPIELRVIARRDYKAPLVMAALTALLMILLLANPRGGETRFGVTTGNDLLRNVPVLTPNAMTLGWIAIAIMVFLTALAFWFSYTYKRQWLWIIGLFALAAMSTFLAWAGAGAAGTINLVPLIGNALLLAIPLVFGALGGVIGERAGVVNIAIEAELLMAAFTATVVGSVTRSPVLGLLAAAIAGLMVAAILAVFAINYRVEQVIVGVVLNVLITGVTTFLFNGWLQPNAMTLNNTLAVRFSQVPIPFLSQIPLIGPALFNQNILVYLMIFAVAAVWFALNRTRWGLRLRAVGEHPKAADTVGIRVNRTRWIALLIAGAIVGIGGASYTLVANGAFNREMTNGFGYIALAAVIFGNWDPIRAAFAALLFGFAISLQTVLSIIGSPVPSSFMLMLPYMVTLLAVAGLVGKSRAPAASGTAYVVEDH